jgi:hypothetical protein
MATINPTHAFNLPGPYQAELSRIADQQRMAEMLQAQSQAPSERFSYKGIEARTPATAGLAKLLQGLGGAYFQGKARDEEKALGERYKTESSDILRKAFEAGAGTPAVAEQAAPRQEIIAPTEEAGGGPGRPADLEYKIPGRAAVAPNPQEMARLLMTSPNPAHEAFGLQQMQKNAQTQAFINAGNAGNAPAPSAAPVATAGGAMPTGGAPGNPPMAAAMMKFGGPAGGQPMSVWMELPNGREKYLEQLAKDFTEQNKLTDKMREMIAAGIKPGSAQWNSVLSALATQGGIGRIDEKGNYSLLPGYAEGQAAVTGATEGAKARFDFIDVPITQPDGTTIIKKMSKEQAAQIMGGGAPPQSGRPLNLTAPTPALAYQIGRQLDENKQPFNIRVPAPGAAGAPSGFGVSDPVQQEAQKAAATVSVKAMHDRLESSFAAAQSSEERMRQVQNIRPILDLPLITGPGATGQMFLSQVANKMYGVANEESLANTRQLITGLAELSLASRGALKGQGPLTEGEQGLLTKAKSAPDSLTVPEYKRLFTLFEKQDKRVIDQHEDFRKRVEKAGIPNMNVWRVDVPTVPTTQLQGLSQETLEAIKRARGEKP